MDFPENIAIIILAAGASSRMDETKQLLPWKDTTLLGNAIRKAKDSNAKSVIVVLGAHAESIRKKIQDEVEIVENTSWASGLGSSIACGTEFLLKSENKTNGLLIMLADQPLIDTRYLNSMMAAFSPEQEIIATAYNNRAGVPALFSASYFGKLTKLKDDFGAKKIIDSNDSDVLVLNPGNKTADIDTKSDYENIIKSKNK